MQTLKTSAIVVLLVTVMYAAYVSLTTPPQTAGPAMDELVRATEEFGIDVGMPGDLDISLGDEMGDFDTGTAFASGDPMMADGGAMPPAGVPQTGVTGSIDDQSSSLLGDGGGAIHGDISDQYADLGGPSSSTPEMDLPDTGGQTADIQISGTEQFDSTGSDDFNMPSAELAGAVFDGTDSGWNQQVSAQSDLPTNVPAENDGSAVDALGSNSPTFADDGQGSIRENPLFDSAEVAKDSSQSSSSDFGLANAVHMADQQYASDQKKQALATLSLFFEKPGLSDADREVLLSRLDPLAREVVYSTKHLLEQPHRVGQNETLMQVAAKYEIPWQLLANINGIDDPITVLPGTDLKVLRGPFRATVDLERNEMTLFLGDLYAGRFPIAIGSDPSPREGTFTVLDKQSARTYYDAAGSPIPPGSPNNPYGSMWMDLGGQLCIHGSPDSNSPTDKGCISVAGRFAGDLFGILSQGSSVTIRR
ncbi:L,D-transpeptidase family protein [Crateriforma spongiae]|uniref:L,D-transpeptidase family protein n=1 Tax=Crateriforma spongiae TaxID=2724528 RepID=UPI0028F43397|nr:L,D-transpeptidase family protein [Crateriforma spongiae]